MENSACIEKNLANAGIRERISWCDIFKGIVIILVVIGHCTGKFNHLIYQFHMAAFFFISGYTSQPKSKALFDEIVKKFYRLMVPYYVINFAGITLFFIADRMNILEKISTTSYPERYQDALIGLVSNSVVYCDWLGAMWFLPVLFGASIVFTIIVKFCEKRWSMLLLSTLVFLFSMNAINKNIHYGNKDLVGLAQFFMTIGYVFKSIKAKHHSSWGYLIKAVIIAGLWGISLFLGFDFVVDWPSRKFNGGVDLFLPFFGIIFVMTFSKMISTSKYLEKIFIYIGRNSMSIMCFHFIGFKVAYLFLIALGWMNGDDFNQLTVKINIGGIWIYITILSIILSIGLWKLLCKNKIINMLLGNDKQICDGLLKVICIQKCKMALELVTSAVKEGLYTFKKELKKNSKGKKLIVIIVGFMVVSFGVKLLSYCGEIYVSFPYYQRQITFGDGWLPQNQIEEYRWIEHDAEFSSFLLNQNTLEIKGYVPENVTGVSMLTIRVNELDVCSVDISSNQIIDIKVDISEFVKKYGKNEFTIGVDGLRVPGETDADQRIFSALINSLKLY